MALIDNLVGYWKLDESSGTRNDSHGTNHMTDVNTVGSGAGKINNGALFTRADGDRLTVANNANLSLGSDTAFTWSFWIKLNTLGATQIVIQKHNDFAGATTTEFQFFIDSSDRLNFDISNGTTNGNVQSPFASMTTSWIFVVAGHDPAADNLWMRLDNGTLLTTSYASGTYAPGFDLFFSSQFGSSFALDGTLDEVAYWKGRSLSFAEQAELWNGGAGKPYADFGGAAATILMGDQLN